MLKMEENELTVKEVYRAALARVFESPGSDEDYDAYSPVLLDSLLAEALPYENAIRRSRGQPVLGRAPRVDKIDDTELDYDERICRVALPFGLAAVILADDESRKSESLLARNEYIGALQDAAPGVEHDTAGWG